MKAEVKRTHTLIIAFLFGPLAALGGSFELVNEPATGGSGKFAAEEIRREATATGMTLGEDANATRRSLTVEKDANAAAQSDRIRVRNDGGRRTITVRGTQTNPKH